MIDQQDESIASRLKAARIRAGLSQGQVAKILDISRPTISEIEAGRRRVSGDEIVRLANIYGTSVTWILENRSEIDDPSLELAARELSKLRKEDLDKVIQLLITLRKSK